MLGTVEVTTNHGTEYTSIMCAVQLAGIDLARVLEARNGEVKALGHVVRWGREPRADR